MEYEFRELTTEEKDEVTDIYQKLASLEEVRSLLQKEKKSKLEAYDSDINDVNRRMDELNSRLKAIRQPTVVIKGQ